MWTLFIILNCLGTCSASPTLAVVQGFSSKETCQEYAKEVVMIKHKESFSLKCIEIK